VISMCYLCRRHEKNVAHLFVECEFIRQLRNYIADTMPISRQGCDIYKNSDFPQKLLTEPYDMFWRQVEATTTFVVWRERCRRFFQDREQKVIQMTREIHYEIKTMT
jgi:hypothetical protein